MSTADLEALLLASPYAAGLQAALALELSHRRTRRARRLRRRVEALRGRPVHGRGQALPSAEAPAAEGPETTPIGWSAAIPRLVAATAVGTCFFRG